MRLISYLTFLVSCLVLIFSCAGDFEPVEKTSTIMSSSSLGENNQGSNTPANLCEEKTLTVAQFCGSDGKVYNKCNDKEYNVIEQFCDESVEYPVARSIMLACSDVLALGIVGDAITTPALACNNKKTANILSWENAPDWGNPSRGAYSGIKVTATCGTTHELTASCLGTLTVRELTCSNLSGKTVLVGEAMDAPVVKCNGAEISEIDFNGHPAWSEPERGIYEIAASAKSGLCEDMTTSCGTLKVSYCAGFDPDIDTTHYGKPKKKFCDERDGKKYTYVKIGNQTWMAENLSYETEGSRCYSEGMGMCDHTGKCTKDFEISCPIYGRLYNWATAMKACPDGWHLPSMEEWNALSESVDPGTDFWAKVTGTKLKTTSVWNQGAGYIAGIDEFGFSALPGGRCVYSNFGDWDGDCFDLTSAGSWWNSNEGERLHYENESVFAFHGYMFYNEKGLYAEQKNKIDFHSVRCIKDTSL